jgi:hypothetical protein
MSAIYSAFAYRAPALPAFDSFAGRVGDASLLLGRSATRFGAYLQLTALWARREIQQEKEIVHVVSFVV